MPLTPEQRSLRARMGAHALHASRDSRDVTAAARAVNTSSDAYWETKVDPDGKLEPGERARRAGHAKREHFARMAYRSALARSAKARARKASA